MYDTDYCHHLPHAYISKMADNDDASVPAAPAITTTTTTTTTTATAAGTAETVAATAPSGSNLSKVEASGLAASASSDGALPKMDANSVQLKAEYILDCRPSCWASIPDGIPNPTADSNSNDRESDRSGGKGKRRKKKKGQNKKRARDEKIDDGVKLCRAVVEGKECTFGERCRYSHDVKAALADRLPDIAEVEGGCPVYNLSGDCIYGIQCRVGSEHINMATGAKLKKEIDGGSKLKEPVNLIPKEVLFQLRKNKYPFVCKRHFEKKGKERMEEAAASCREEVQNPVPSRSELQPVDLSPLPAKRKLIDFRNKVYVAPLTTVGNLPFRRIMKRFGADITCGEMAVGTSLCQGQQGEWALLRRHPDEDIFGVQIACGFADQFTRTSELIETHCQVDFVDLNLGCPLDMICDKGAGAMMMLRNQKLKNSLLGISKTLSCPFTVKMRTGWAEDKPFAHELVRKIQSWQIDGLSAVMLHGRSRLQRYSRLASWDYIAKVANHQTDDFPKIPIIGNGDVFSYQDYEEKVAREGIETTAMLARGALIKPWLPTEIKERRNWDISASERLDMLKEFVKFGLEHWGSDTQGVNNIRRFLLEWLSFLYRYVPVGLLEVLPQQLNHRPPPNMCGRTDLETLMLSNNAVDWIKISEMLLGPVPDGFRFDPKHKANAFPKSG